MQRELVFHLCRRIFVSGVDVEDVAFHFVEPDSSEELIESIRTDDQCHSRAYRLVLYLSYNHGFTGSFPRAPGADEIPPPAVSAKP